MGITITYRGRIDDMTRIEDFEDRVLDLALELGGQAQIWRSSADDDPARVVRGILLNLAPGQETTSLLLSPEGWLVGLADIEDAELGRLTEPPWNFVKTQFGSVEGHVALVEMLDKLRQEYLSDLEINDEGGYYPARDLAELVRRRTMLEGILDGMADALQRHGLHGEAAEDPEILLKRIERIAAQVHQTLQRPPEHPPVTFPEDDDVPGANDPAEIEALWDEMFKHNRRMQEWMQRSMEERHSAGDDYEAAFEKALNDLGLDLPDEAESEDEPWHDEEPESFLDLPDNFADEDSDDDNDPLSEMERHPLLKRATDLLHDLHMTFRDADGKFESALHSLFQGAGDAMGGLAQALSMRAADYDDYGLRIVQLKRALRGAGFARGSLFLLRSAITKEQLEDFWNRLNQLVQDIFQELERTQSEHRGEEM